MLLSAGTRLGPYEIVAPLGSGGMGEVFEARDTRLGRPVAIKVLRPELAASADGRARFEREAKVIASLAHPHICTLHDVGEAVPASPPSGSEHRAPTSVTVNYLVMELLDGETLAERLARGPLSMDDTIACATQVADALDRAHEQGVVHRDLKPANIMLTRSGVKLLDFGLARLRPSPALHADAVTQATPHATEGIVLGTLPYMAPEQLEGREVDARADLFAFGAVVFEMVTGRRAFGASSQAGLIGEILKADPPPITALNSAAPPSLDRLVSLCLAKDPDDRWSTAHDVLLLLRGIVADARRAPSPPVVRRGGRQRAAWTLAAVLALVAAFLAGRAGWRPGEATLDFVSVLPPPGTAITGGEAPQVSPDGRQVAFVATDASGRTLLYVRARDTLDARALPGSEDVTLPFWSPDSRQLGFFAGGALKTVALSGGEPRTLASAPVPRGGTWSREGVIVFVPFPDELPMRVSAAGGNAETVPVADLANDRRWFPSFLPDGRHYVYLSLDPARRQGSAIRVASRDSTEVKELVPSRTSAVYAEPGYLLFRRDTALVAQRFDARRLELLGAPIVVAENVGFNAITYQGSFSASNAGALAYMQPDPGWHLVWFDRHGRRLGTALEAGQYNSLCISPDGQHVVYDLADGSSGDVDIWSLDLARGLPSRLTFDPTVDFHPVCSPTGDEVLFASLRSGPPTLFRQSLKAPGNETRLPLPPGPKTPNDWSRDGRLIVYSAYSAKTGWDIWVVPASGDGQPFSFAATDAEERHGRLSPDGRWMAYTLQSNQAPEVYVQPFPTTGARWQVSRGGGLQPAWRADGRELYYISPDKKLVAVDVAAATSDFAVGPPHVVVETSVAGWERTNQGSPFVVTPDGQRFLVSNAGGPVMPITLVLNWIQAFKKQLE